MNRADIFSSATRPQSTMSAVKDYWAEYPDRFARALRPPARRTAAEELYSHLALDRSPRTGNPRTSSAGSATSSARAAPSPAVRAGDFSQQRSAPQAPWRASARVDGPARSLHGELGTFFSAAEAQRAHVSPLGGKVW